VGQKKRYMDKVCTELNNIFQNAIEHPSDKHYRRVSVLSSLKTHIENIPDWPFSTTSIVRLVTTAGAVAALIPAIEFFRKLLEKP
ncbi:MAG TPA: hypothetical protein VGW32_06485, partial [Pyrinomonadaceae bacterium]|nr:hypothetical protein [Pyrinomonadaceae bacterium]